MATRTPGNDTLRAAVRAEVAPLMEALERFVDRRLQELSAELHCATELAGFTEEAIGAQIRTLHEQVAQILAPPGRRHAGGKIELEAVVETTETAANQIMEAAEAISEAVRRSLPDPGALTEISKKIDMIFEACAFQDLTGQRVRRAIAQLQHVETTLEVMMGAPDAAPRVTELPAHTADPSGPEASQAEIDALFG